MQWGSGEAKSRTESQMRLRKLIPIHTDWFSSASEWVSFALPVSRPDLGPNFFSRNARGTYKERGWPRFKLDLRDTGLREVARQATIISCCFARKDHSNTVVNKQVRKKPSIRYIRVLAKKRTRSHRPMKEQKQMELQNTCQKTDIWFPIVDGVPGSLLWSHARTTHET